MNRSIKNNIWTVAIAIVSIAMPLAACSSEDNEVVNGIDSRPQKETTVALAAYSIDSQETRTSTDSKLAVFTDEDIEWFDQNTRELRFSVSSEEIHHRLEALDRMEFRLGDDVLFQVDNLVNPSVSRTYFDLVLYYEFTWQNDEKVEKGYFLYDCYPSQFIDEELTVSNREKRASQWEAFTKYLESKGKLRK